jgi:hypothetical protein
MKTVNAEEYYKAHIGDEREYVRLAAAREVKAGEIVFIEAVSGTEQAVAPKDGYEAKHYITGPKFSQFFVSKANALHPDKLELAVPKKDLTAEELERIKPVQRGDEFTVEGENGYTKYAEKDGFFITQQDGKEPLFMSNFELLTAFNYAGKKRGIQEEIVIADKTKPPVTGIILKEDVIFAFKSSQITAPAGSFLWKNPDDEDGYTVEEGIRSPNAVLRIAPQWLEKQAAKARHEVTSARQEELKKRKPQIKLV